MAKCSIKLPTFLLLSSLLFDKSLSIKDGPPSVCSVCICMGHSPFRIDCMNIDLKTVPSLLSHSNNKSSPWRLDIGNNLIEEIPPFIYLKNLITVSAKHNDIIKVADSAFKDLPDLTSVDLSHNKLTKDAVFKDVFRGSYNPDAVEPIGLKSLDLSYNYLEGLEDDAFKHLPNLTHLILNNNNLFDLSISTARAFSDLSSLMYIDLSYTGLRRLPAHFLGDLRNLQNVVLAGNMFTNVPSEVTFIRNLISLNLNNNPIKEITKEDFPERVKYLEELKMSAMSELQSVNDGAFSNLLNLRYLQMTENVQFTVIGPNAFGDAGKNLKKLELQNSRLSALTEEMLPWFEIEEVNIQENPWNCDCHFGWVKDKLLPSIEASNPHLSLNILCAEPQSVQGKNLKDIDDSYKWDCTKSFKKESSNEFQGAVILAVIIVGSLLLLVGTAAFAHILFKNSQVRNNFGQTVKYRRAFNEDEEGVPKATI